MIAPLTTPQILDRVAACPGLTATELAKSFGPHVKGPSLGSRLYKLCQAGLLNRKLGLGMCSVHARQRYRTRRDWETGKRTITPIKHVEAWRYFPLFTSEAYKADKANGADPADWWKGDL